MEKFCRTIFGFWALAFILISSPAKSQTPGGANGMVFRFTKQVWLNPTIILAKQNFEQSTNVKLLILPRVNGDDTTGSSRIEKAFDKLLSFLVFKENVQGSIKFYFNPKNTTKPFTFNTSDELHCKFTPIQKDSVETILNKDIVNSSNLNNFTALPFDSIINRASRYCKKILQSKPGPCGENPGNEFTMTKINSTPAKLNFEKGMSPNPAAPNGGVDAKKYPELEQYYNTVLDVADNSNYPLSWKAMAANTSDVVKLKLKKKQSYFDIDKLVFKNANGTETYNVTYSNINRDSVIDLSISGKSPGSMAEVVAFYTPTTTPTQTFAIGAFNVQFYEPKTLNVVLVNLGGATMPNTNAIKDSLNKIYGQVFITWNVTTANCTLPGTINKNIQIENSGLLSNYMPDMQPILNHFKNSPAYADNDDDTYYLLFGATNDGNLEGYMPRGRNIGFIFSTSAHTIAHELGHGAFNLKHIFCSEELGEGNRGNTDNIMDYSTGKRLYKHQWDLIHNPNFVSWFDGDDEEGAFYATMLTPLWEPFTFTGSNTWLTQKPVLNPNGAVYGVIYQDENYRWNGTAYAAGTKILPITINTEPKDELAIELYWNKGVCGLNELYTTTWGYIKDKKNNFDPKLITDGGVTYKERIPCQTSNPDEVTNNSFDECKNIDLSKLNKERLKLEAIDLNWTSSRIADTIMTVNKCVVYQLDYTYVEPLIKKLGVESDYSENMELSLVRLLNAVIDDKIPTIYANALMPEDFKILRLMIDEIDGNEYTSFLEVLGYLGQKLDTDQRKWSLVNVLVKERFSNIKDERETTVLNEVIGSLTAYAANPAEVPAKVGSFTHLLIDQCEHLQDFKVVFDIGVIRLNNLELFSNFTQADILVIEQPGLDAIQSNDPKWLIPQKLVIGDHYYQKVELPQFYAWSKYLSQNTEVEDLLTSNPSIFFGLFVTELNTFMTTQHALNDYYWANVSFSDCNKVYDVVKHVRALENTASLRKVDKNIKLTFLKEIFNCQWIVDDFSNQTSSVIQNGADAITKVVTSFDEGDKDVLVTIEEIGFDKIYSALSGKRLSAFCVWAGSHAISCGKVIDLPKADVLKSNGDILDVTSLFQLESNLFQFDNFSGRITNKIQIQANSKTIPYNQMVLVYIADDFTFLEQEFKKGSVMAVPMIQAFAMSNSNRNIVTEKSIWLGVDILSFAVGIGEVKVFFTVGNYLRKAIVLSDLIGTGAGALSNSLNESAISPELRFQIQMLSVVASLPQLATSFKNVNNLISRTDAAINNLSGIPINNQNQLINYFSKIKLRLSPIGSNILEVLSQIKSKLGFRPANALNFTGFAANTSDEFVDIVIHFHNGKFVVSKEGALTTELLIDDLAEIINTTQPGKTVRLLSCNDMGAAKQLSQLTNKPFYASDGWVDLYANGEVRSQNAFHKFENGNQSTTDVILSNSTEILGVKKVTLGIRAAGSTVPTSLIAKLTQSGANKLKTWTSNKTLTYKPLTGANLSGASAEAKIFEDLESAIGNKTVLETVEDGQGRLAVVLERPGQTHQVVTIHSTSTGEFKITTLEPGYNPNLNPSIPVPASSNKLAPDYVGTQYLHPLNQGHVIKIKMTGKRTGSAGDFAMADAEMRKLDPNFVKPGGYTWHHLDDFNPVTGECTMQLVESTAHQGLGVVGMSHSGSVAQWKAYYGSSSNAPNGLFYQQ